MKLFPLSLLLFLGCNSYSQTLTQAFNEPVVGNIDSTRVLDTTLFITGLPISISGSTCIWNFTNLMSYNSIISSVYVNTVSVPSSSNYTGCNLVAQEGQLNTYYKTVSTPTTQTELLGLTSNTLSLTFTNTGVIARYPIAYNYTLSDNIGGTFTFSLNGNFSGNINSKADGLGTLLLPAGQTFSNVLRIKSVQTLTLTSGFIPVATIKQTMYSFYHSSQKFPILNVNYQAISVFGSTTPSVSALVSGSVKNFLFNSISSFDKEWLQLKLFPNPAIEVVTLEFNNPNFSNCKAELYSPLGQLLKTMVLGNQKIINGSFSTETLPPGIYLMKIQLDERELVQKIVVE